MAGFRIEGNTSGNVAEVDVVNNMQVITPGYNSAGVAKGGGDINGPAIFSEVDAGTVIGTRSVLSPETDDDYRLRVAHDNWLDEEQFADAAQNTNKFQHVFTTLTATESSSGLLTNSANITTTTTGMTFGTWAQFPISGTQTLVVETALAFTAQPNANQVIDFGPFQRSAATPFAPLDGACFRMSSTGMQGVISVNGVETSTAVFPASGGTGTFVYTNNTVYKWLIQTNNVKTTFWINNIKYGEIVNPAGAGTPALSRSLPWSIRHAILGGTAGSATQALIKSYRIFLRGPQYSERLSVVGNKVYGSYEGLSGGTMGQLGTYPNSTNQTAAVPTNTALTANLPAGLGGMGLITAPAGAATDLILGSYQVPVGSTTSQGRRLCIRGVKVDAINTGAAVATTATVLEWKLAVGHTAVSLATAETASFVTATAKAPRRLGIGYMTWPVGAAIGAPPTQNSLFLDLGDAPKYANPGEFVQIVAKVLVGTATASQTIQYMWQPVYSWE
ncbi:hypothetical protein UFOVP61_43 [uncultured Caudovirales phage]|uniref:Uncharacterized protein n=1 Tax=uncultured Caudovirales phage TaxID=2100421 RepID=A0A6J5KUR1_9CAUD|nr:hypothetical protein UFOVP61_43 [uncultured Caudovirales phage]